MEQELEVTGIILDEGPVGEFDKRASLLTFERGRISVFLKGVKRPGRNPLSFLSPFCYGKFYLFEGRNSYTVKKADIQNRFEGVTKDLSNLAYGSYFLDVAKYYSRERSDEGDRIKLLYVALLSLVKKDHESEFIRLVYELKNICIQGEYPNVFECSACKGRKELYLYEPERRTILCRKCAGKKPGTMPVNEPVLKALTHIFITEPEKVLSFKLSEKSVQELRAFADRYISKHFPHKFKTLEYLEILTNI